MTEPLPGFQIVRPRHPSKKDVAFLSDQLFAFNRIRQGERFQEVAVFIKDDKKQILAGVSGLHRWGWAHIDVLWVSEKARGMGFGTLLMELVEDKFREEGCAMLDLHTFSFQAPGFYEKMGYQKTFEQEIGNAGARQIFFRKDLNDPSSKSIPRRAQLAKSSFPEHAEHPSTNRLFTDLCG